MSFKINILSIRELILEVTCPERGQQPNQIRSPKVPRRGSSFPGIDLTRNNSLFTYTEYNFWREKMSSLERSPSGLTPPHTNVPSQEPVVLLLSLFN